MNKKLVSILLSAFSDLKKISKIIILLLFILYICSGFYFITQSELGVLQRFGKVVDDKVVPGIHYAFPWPIDKVDKVPVKIIKRMFIDDFVQSDDEKSGSYRFYQMSGLSSYCISGDNNIIEISCVLHYTIADPVKYLFKVNNNEQLLNEITCHTIIHCLAKLNIDDILKRKILDYLKNNLQQNLDFFDTGLTITFIELKEVRPPEAVQQYFDDVINARIDKIKMKNDAESYKNDKIPDAKGNASRINQEATAYKDKIVAIAKGESERFLNELKEYEKSKTIIKKQLYIEFIRQILQNVDDKYIISSKDKRNPAHLKIFLTGEKDSKDE